MSQALAKLLAPFRKSESADQLATILDSSEAVRVLAAWSGTRKKWKKPAGKMPKSPDLRWDWLWTGVSMDLEALAVSTRLSERGAHATLRALVNARLVYPDGTLAEPASRLIRDYVARRANTKEKPARNEGGAPTQVAVGQGHECPKCGAKPGERCKAASGNPYQRTRSHKAREALDG